ncbi:MAG: GlsB/YeaQ/YmgE family stress response membrane protein [Bacteroidales bacterium]|nr:GlsB/YeaQ/YmgE family stress response membrane protein [Bacteroidales bacterium]
MGLILTIVIGIVAGYLGSLIFKGSGSGLLLNLIIGLVGSFIGGWLMVDVLHVTLFGGLLDTILFAVIGSIIPLWIISLIRK